MNACRCPPAQPTSWCTAACLPLWSAAACWAWSCCGPRTSCHCGRRCRGSRSCWPSGCWDAARPWALWTLTSRPSSSVWRRRQWCTPAGGGNPHINTLFPAWESCCAVLLFQGSLFTLFLCFFFCTFPQISLYVKGVDLYLVGGCLAPNIPLLSECSDFSIHHMPDQIYLSHFHFMSNPIVKCLNYSFLYYSVFRNSILTISCGRFFFFLGCLQGN